MKKPFIRLLWIALLIFIVGLVYLILFRVFGFALPCMFHEWTGFNCPGCGLTRAVGAVSRFAFIEALGYNPMLPVYVLYSGWFAGTASVRYLKGKEDPLLFGPQWLHIAMLTLTILFGILRNLLPLDII